MTPGRRIRRKRLHPCRYRLLSPAWRGGAAMEDQPRHLGVPEGEGQEDRAVEHVPA